MLQQLGLLERAGCVVTDLGNVPDTRAATEFSLTRFLTPALAGYDGYAVFVAAATLALIALVTIPVTMMVAGSHVPVRDPAVRRPASRQPDTFRTWDPRRRPPCERDSKAQRPAGTPAYFL